MKEKISCSLDGDLVTQIDVIIRKYPVINNRSALLEMACYQFIDLYNQWASYDLTERTTFSRESNKRVEFIQRIYERRCELNAQKESKN